MSVKMPLKKANGTYSIPLHPTELSVSLSLDPLSTADMTLPPEDEIAVMDWVLIETPDGTVGEYRVSGVETDMETGFHSVQLEHGVCELGDVIIRTQDGHTDGISMTDTVEEIVSFICEFSGMWNVGTIAATGTVYIDLGGSTPLDALMKMMESIPNYQLEFDQGVTWSVNIKARSTTPVCEGRLSRNLNSCKVSRDMSNLVTRVCSEQLDGGVLDSTNINVYGIHEQYLSLNDNLTAAQQLAIATSILNTYDHPTLSISISGVELSQVTGLALDKFAVGTVCRLAVPWMGITENETIISKEYSDVLGSPEKVSITLANAKPDLSISVAPSSRGSGGAQRKIKSDNIAMVVHDADINKTNERIMLWATESQWDEISQQYHLSQRSQFEVTSSQIQSTVLETGSTAGVYQFDANHPYVYGEKCLYNGGLYRCSNPNGHSGAWNAADFDPVSSMQSQITQTKNSISLIVDPGTGDVTPAYIKLAINNDTSSVKIRGDTIDLNGYVTAIALSAGSSISSDIMIANDVLYAHSAELWVGGDTYSPIPCTADLEDEKVVKDLSVTESGGVFTMTWKDYDETPHTVNFSRAATTHIKGSWSSGIFTVGPDPSSQLTSVSTDLHTKLVDFQQTQSGTNINFTGKVYTRYYDGSTWRQDSYTGRDITGTVDASAVWQDGWDTAELNIDFPITVDPKCDVQQNLTPTMGLGFQSVTVNAVTMSNIPTQSAPVGPRPMGTYTLNGYYTVADGYFRINVPAGQVGLASIARSGAHSSYDMDDTGLDNYPLEDPIPVLSANSYYRVVATANDGTKFGTRFKTPAAGHTTAHSNCASGLTQVNQVSPATPTTLYYRENGTYRTMGTGWWYYRSNSYMQPTTMYT